VSYYCPHTHGGVASLVLFRLLVKTSAHLHRRIIPDDSLAVHGAGSGAYSTSPGILQDSFLMGRPQSRPQPSRVRSVPETLAILFSPIHQRFLACGGGCSGGLRSTHRPLFAS
jgi:hypothetical protein